MVWFLTMLQRIMNPIEKFNWNQWTCRKVSKGITWNLHREKTSKKSSSSTSVLISSPNFSLLKNFTRFSLKSTPLSLLPHSLKSTLSRKSTLVFPFSCTISRLLCMVYSTEFITRSGWVSRLRRKHQDFPEELWGEKRGCELLFPLKWRLAKGQH